jgi:hypothetical protein
LKARSTILIDILKERGSQTSLETSHMGDKISSEQTFPTKAGKLKISCLAKPASPSLDLYIALAITVFIEFIQITLLCE